MVVGDEKMEKNKIYEEKTVHNFRALVSSCTKEYGSRIAFTIKDKEKKLLRHLNFS